MDAMSGEPEYKIVAAPFDSALFEHVRKIRIDVFVHEQGYPLEDEMDEYDSETFHLLLLHRSPTASADFPELGGYEPAGTLRYFPPPKNKVGRVAVSKHFRGKGLGGVMMKGLESILRGDFVDAPNFPGGKATEISMHAQVPVVPFYKSLGYDTEGDEFIEDGTPHVLMRKSLVFSGGDAKATGDPSGFKASS